MLFVDVKMKCLEFCFFLVLFESKVLLEYGRVEGEYNNRICI